MSFDNLKDDIIKGLKSLKDKGFLSEVGGYKVESNPETGEINIYYSFTPVECANITFTLVEKEKFDFCQRFERHLDF